MSDFCFPRCFKYSIVYDLVITRFIYLAPLRSVSGQLAVVCVCRTRYNLPRNMAIPALTEQS